LRRRSDGIERVYAAAGRTDERAFEVDPENLRRESRLGIARAANVTRDGAVTVVATNDVVPRRATVEATLAIASAVPSITSWPPAP
jgi:hypothetical protein